ncbi:unnamed protein product [Sphagnum balticum]
MLASSLTGLAAAAATIIAVAATAGRTSVVLPVATHALNINLLVVGPERKVPAEARVRVLPVYLLPSAAAAEEEEIRKS